MHAFRSQYLFLLTFCVAFALLGMKVLEHRRLEGKGNYLEALVAVISNVDKPSRRAQGVDFINFTEFGAREYDRLGFRGSSVGHEQLQALGLSEVQDLEISTHDLMLLGNFGYCRFLTLELESDEDLVIDSVAVLGPRYAFLSESQVFAFHASQCSSEGNHPFSGLVISAPEDNFVYMPTEYIKAIPGLRVYEKELQEFRADSYQGMILNLPDSVAPYFEIPKYGAIVPFSAIKKAVVDYVRAVTGEVFPIDNVESAIFALFKSELSNSSLGGLSSSAESLLKISPVIIMISLWVLLRTIMYHQKKGTHDLWLANDVDDLAGKIVAIVFSMSIPLAILFSAIVYCAAFSITGAIGNMMWGIDENLTLSVTRISGEQCIPCISRNALWVGFFWWPCIFLSVQCYSRLLSESLSSVSKP